jgi:signal transduction histidine kinase
VLSDARSKADQDTEPARSVEEGRADADDLLEDERAAADALVRGEREDSARLLSALLPLARQSTDRKLFTERASAEAALSARDDFLGIVSHDLNNLLAGIVLSASSIERRLRDRPGPETTDDRRISQGADRILMYAARMRRLVGDLVDVTSMTAGSLRMTAVPCDAWSLVSETVETFRLIAAEKRITLVAERMNAPLMVMCDADRILQVLPNLVGNALKFTPEGGTVSLRCERVDGETRFSVIDTGPGIPADLLEAVFERFWQAGADDRRGLGLGLYIAKGIVEAHGGRIWVQSLPGEGSAFHFTLPRVLATDH